jgi:hypothetical protein
MSEPPNYEVERTIRLLLLSLYSEHYPSIGESHGLSVIAGCVMTALKDRVEEISVIDMVGRAAYDEALIRENFLRIRPTVIGISVGYGCFQVLRRLYPKLKELSLTEGIGDPLVVFGGALATYLPDLILNEIDPGAVVVAGEGDEAFPLLLSAWLNMEHFGNVPNICYMDNEKLIRTQRRLVDTNGVAQPFREHIQALAHLGTQIYTEASRGCSWAACSFCLRGLTDIRGIGSEYRRFPKGRLLADLSRLQDYGIHAVTFADEDFLGGSIEDAEQLVMDLEEGFDADIRISFDVSMTVHSIVSERMDESESYRRRDLLRRLQRIGLRKVFFGIESGSPSQLRRYAKGHTLHECAEASRLVRDSGLDLELGFIMFDPLCSLSEIEENLAFLLKNGLVEFTSFLGSELRLQVGARYLTVLERAERESGRSLYERKLDPDTLSFAYTYLDERVAILVNKASEWNRLLRPMHYPLKNLSRYGSRGILGEAREDVQGALRDIRNVYARRLLEAATTIGINPDRLDGVDRAFRGDLKVFSLKVVEVFSGSPGSIRTNPIVESVVDYAREYLAASII